MAGLESCTNFGTGLEDADLKPIPLVFWKSASGRNPTGGFDARAPALQGIVIMSKENKHLGSSFESGLDEKEIREEVTAAAVKAVIAHQLAEEMKKKRITKKRMAELMKTSRAQVDRLLDPDSGSATIESLQRAARIVGRDISLQLV
jgi:predicted XRE-type DNA-binding protein